MATALTLVAFLGLAGTGIWVVRRLRQLGERVAELAALRREVQALREETARAFGITRAHLAAVAGGERPAREAIVRGTPHQDIAPAEALRLYEQTPELFVLDVRTPAEYAHGHIPNARLIPVDELEDRLGEVPRDVPVLVYCAAGGRSQAACETLGRQGFTRLLNLAGGMHAWTGPRSRPEETPPPPASTPAGTAIAYRGGPITEAAVVAAIRECHDPEIPLNIFDLGLIYGIDIDEASIAVRMTLTSEGCPSARTIPEDVKRRITALGQPNVVVDVVFDPPWHPSRISEGGKQKLGLA